VTPPWSLQQAAALEALRTARSGRGFSLLRIAPFGAGGGWVADSGELEVLSNVVAGSVRKTDYAVSVREAEVGVVLIELTQADAVVARLRAVIRKKLPWMDVRIGWAAVGPGQLQTWQEGWKWAGQLLVADAAVRVAA
jgi:hypothetical protein